MTTCPHRGTWCARAGTRRARVVTEGRGMSSLLLVLLLLVKVTRKLVACRGKPPREFGGTGNCSGSAAMRSSPLSRARVGGPRAKGADKRRNVMKPFSAGGMTFPRVMDIIQRTPDICWNSHHIANAVQRSTVYLW